MAAPDSLPADVKASLDKLARIFALGSAAALRTTQLHAHLLGSVIASTLFLATGLPLIFEIVCYVGAIGCAAVGAWMHLTLRTLDVPVPWYWWVWTVALPTVAVLDMVVDL